MSFPLTHFRSQSGGDKQEMLPTAPQQAVATGGAEPVAMETVKQKSIEHHVPMSISNQMEQQIMSQEQGRSVHGFGPEEESLSALLPRISDVSQPGMLSFSQAGVQPASLLSSPSSIVSSSHHQSSLPDASFVSSSNFDSAICSAASTTTFEENQAAVERILGQLQKANEQPQHRKDHNYNFAPGLFPSEVDLEGSQQAYQTLLQGLDDPSDFLRLFDQVEANPLRQPDVFGVLDFERFD